MLLALEMARKARLVPWSSPRFRQLAGPEAGGSAPVGMPAAQPPCVPRPRAAGRTPGAGSRRLESEAWRCDRRPVLMRNETSTSAAEESPWGSVFHRIFTRRGIFVPRRLTRPRGRAIQIRGPSVSKTSRPRVSWSAPGMRSLLNPAAVRPRSPGPRGNQPRPFLFGTTPSRPGGSRRKTPL